MNVLSVFVNFKYLQNFFFFFKYVTPLLPSNLSCLHYNILFSSLCLVKLDHNRRYFCITQATRICIFFLSHVYNNVFKRVGN